MVDDSHDPNPGIKQGSRHQVGSIVGQECNGGNLRLSKSHTPSEVFVVERADLDDLMVVLDAMLGQRTMPYRKGTAKP